MLAYLDALLAALTLRDGAEIERLLGHPLARTLPADVREEATAFAVGGCDPLAAPLKAMHLRHRTAELLLEEVPVADRPEAGEPARAVVPPPRPIRAARHHQMELPLSA